MAAIDKFRYKIDLRRYMADCDANYLRLIKLFPEFGTASSRTIALAGNGDQVLAVTVLERTPYTTLITLQQRDRCSRDWLALPSMTVRLYHDARVAEVVRCEGQRAPFPRNDYPNTRMHQQDEKAQWNCFLTELLAHCLAHGRSTQALFEPS